MTGRFWAAVLLLVAILGSARAQMIPFDNIESIDAKVLDSKTVVVGHVTDVVETSQTDKGYHDVTIRPTETIKGAPDLPVKFPIWALGTGLEEWERWKANGTALLMCVPSRPVNPWNYWPIDLERPNLFAVMKEFRPIRDREALLAYVRKIVRENPGVVSVETYPLRPPEGPPGDAIRQVLGHPKLHALVVPVDDRVRRALLAELHSKDFRERTTGAREVAVLKTPETIALLNTLLKDPAYSAYPAGINRGIEVRRYVVREAAYDTLTYRWKLAVPKPVVEERVSVLDVLPELDLNGRLNGDDVAAIRGAKRLAKLDVRAYGEPPAGLLDAALGAPGLRSLGLTGANIGDADLVRLAGLKELRSLGLDENPITDAGLKTLAGMKRLTNVSLRETEVTDAGLAALRQARPDLKVEPERAFSPLRLYFQRGDLASARRVIDRNPSAVMGDALPAAAYWRRYDAVKMLLDRGAPVEGDGTGETPLQSAFDFYDPDFSVVELLLGRGADSNRAKPDGTTPLDAAWGNSNSRLVNLLLASGARLSGRLGPEGRTPETRDVLARFERAKADAVLVRPTAAKCKRIVYALAQPDDSLLGWSSEPIGPFTGRVAWSRTPTGRAILGPFGQQRTTLSLDHLPEHGNVRIDLELFIIGSWDGNGGLVSEPDILDIAVPGVGRLLHSTFFNNTEDDAGLPMQSFPDPYPFGFHTGYTGASEVRTLGYAQNWEGRTYRRDGVYHLSFTFAHRGPSLKVVFSGLTVTEGEGSLADSEEWGLGRMVVRTDR